MVEFIQALDSWQVVVRDPDVVIKQGWRCRYCGMIYGPGTCSKAPPPPCCGARAQEGDSGL